MFSRSRVYFFLFLNLFPLLNILLLRYRGAVDDVTFRNRQASRFFLEEAIEALLEGHLPTLTETPAYGCAIVREI